MANVIGFIGWKDSGKTTLIERVIACLVAAGHSVATVKHAHHAFDIDHPGKDSFRHRAAGAAQVIVASRRRWAMIAETPEEAEPELDELLARLAPADIVIVEGYKRHAHPKIQVIRAAAVDATPITDDADIVAYVTDMPDLAVPGPVLAIDDPAAVAAFVCARLGLAAAR